MAGLGSRLGTLVQLQGYTQALPCAGEGEGREQKAAAPWGLTNRWLERETESWQWGQPGHS